MNVRKVDSVPNKDQVVPQGEWTGALQEEGRQRIHMTPEEEDPRWGNNRPEDLHLD